MAEGIDFDNHFGRCVVLMGVPYQYTLSHVLRQRLDYMRTKFQIRAEDFLTFDALRQAAQCVGRVMRSKNDYGAMIFADSRYNRSDKRDKLPKWIQNFLNRADRLNASTDDATSIVQRFLREMAQPLDEQAQRNILMDMQRLNGTTPPMFTATSTANTTTTIAPATVNAAMDTARVAGTVAAAAAAAAAAAMATTATRSGPVGCQSQSAEEKRQPAEKRPRFEYA